MACPTTGFMAQRPIPGGFGSTRRGDLAIYRLAEHHALRSALSIELFSATEMQFLFPESEILRERVGGVTKSLVAVRR